jgi:hypothetical protein
MLALATAAFADFDTDAHTYKGCPGTAANRVDPVNVVLWDWGTWDRAVSQIASHLAWSDAGGSTQSFVDHGNCHPMQAQRASAGTTSSRFHVRLRPIHFDTALGWTSVGDAHHEDFVWYCGHAVDSNGPSGSGFDQGRRELRTRFEAAGHDWYSRWWGNTQNFKQCDGDYAGSDGYTVFIRAHQVNH